MTKNSHEPKGLQAAILASMDAEILRALARESAEYQKTAEYRRFPGNLVVPATSTLVVPVTCTLQELRLRLL